MDSDKKVVLVTGSFSGIGQAIALTFAAQGWKVYASGRNLDKSTELREEIKKGELDIEVLKLDVTQESEILMALAHIGRNSKRLDVLVNNAGFGVFGAVLHATDEQIRKQFDVNVIGPVSVARGALEIMKKNGEGRIINVSSALGKFSFPGTGVYAASKFALEALSDALRFEIKIFGPRFHVSVIEPGLIKTKFDENIFEGALAKQEGENPYGGIFSEARKLSRELARNIPGPEVVAAVIFRAATAANPKPRYVVTIQAKALLTLQKLLPETLMDFAIMRVSGLRSQIKKNRKKPPQI